MAYIQQDLRGQPNDLLVENWQKKKEIFTSIVCIVDT